MRMDGLGGIARTEQEGIRDFAATSRSTFAVDCSVRLAIIIRKVDDGSCFFARKFSKVPLATVLPANTGGLGGDVPAFDSSMTFSTVPSSSGDFHGSTGVATGASPAAPGPSAAGGGRRHTSARASARRSASP